WRKFLPTDLTSPWWYDPLAIKKLAFSHIAAAENGHEDLPLRDFVRQFRGLSRTGKIKEVCDRFPDVRMLRDFLNSEYESSACWGSCGTSPRRRRRRTCSGWSANRTSATALNSGSACTGSGTRRSMGSSPACRLWSRPPSPRPGQAGASTTG